MTTYDFSQLEAAPLVLDAVYKSKGTAFGHHPLNELLPKVSNQGGIRVVRSEEKEKIAYIVLYTSLGELEWPDNLDTETGIFRYFGDNRTPGKALHDTPRKGNVYLKKIFESIDVDSLRQCIPPILVFSQTGNQFDVKFLGLAVPGNPNVPQDRELNAIWRTKYGQRFQNYEAYFTILDTGLEEVSKKWLYDRIHAYTLSDAKAPSAWRKFIIHGRQGISPLTAPRNLEIPTKEEQLPRRDSDISLIRKIKAHYTENPYGFELCATRILQMMDNNFEEFDLTRPWRDGGRDALAKYRIGTNHNPLLVDCAVEAKCYSPDNAVGVREVSRLISRLRYRQFGVLVTTSYIHKQAYSEIAEDGHPVLIVHASDISATLQRHGINTENVEEWLEKIEQT